MNDASLTAAAPRAESGAGSLTASRAFSWVRLALYLELTKPRITSMVLVTAAAGFVLAHGALVPTGDASLPLTLLLHTLAGTGLVAASGSVLNMVLERHHDARMRRTASRPLPAGKLEPDRALAFGVALGVVGLLWLALAANLLTAVLAAVTLITYVFVYTPMKRLSSLATVVGAAPGAMPPVMGWAAYTGELGPGAWALFGILFFWQLPHFLAIAWMYRADYARAGFPMLPVVEPDGGSTSRQAVLWSAALVPLSLLPAALGLAGWVYAAGALLLGLAYLGASLGFGRARTAPTARRLLLASILYLPGILGALLADRLLM